MLTNEIVRTDPMIDRLAADRAHVGLVDELRLFDQFVGSWDIDMTSYGNAGNPTSYAAEWHFGRILQGRAIQDVLITRSVETGDLLGYGSTVRTFDERRGLWWIDWQDPVAGEFAALLGRGEGDRIVLDGQWTIGQARDSNARFRWTFSDITPETFHWEGHFSNDDGASWQLRESMEARRRTAG